MLEMKILIDTIQVQLKEIHNGKIWIGTTVFDTLKLFDEKDAFSCPNNVHNAAEIIAHLTFWRKETILKIKTGKGIMTDESPENWLGNAALKKIGWTKIMFEYRQSLDELLEILQLKNDAFLKEKYYDTDYKGYYQYQFLLNGMLHHDLYHLGQLRILLKFLSKNKES